MSTKIPTSTGYEEWIKTFPLSDPPPPYEEIWAAAINYKNKQTLKILSDQIELLESYKAHVSVAALDTVRSILIGVDANRGSKE